MKHFLLLLLVLLVAGTHSKSEPSTVRIYSNLAEIIKPLEKLPLEFHHEDWQNIRRDSVTLLGVNVTSQTITEKKKCLDGTQIYIRWPSSSSSNKDTIKLIKGILVDETKNLVKFQDESIAGEQFLYFTVPYDQILYLEKPPESKFYVNFTYDNSESSVYVSYLRSNLNWRTRYQLNLYNDESVLIAMADIRNDGKSSISIEQAELIGGDINLRMQTSHYEVQPQSISLTSSFRASSAGAMMFDSDVSPPSVAQGEELAGLYIFAINQPFTIESKTNYLLPMFRPRVTVERYGLISKIFSTLSNNGKAQRSYRLKSDRYLSRGNCILRELDRLVGETSLPDLAAKDKYEFSIGQDADVIYKENVTLITSTTFNETESIIKTGSPDGLVKLIVHPRTRSTYDVHVEVKNFKKRPVNVEYEQKGFYGYRHVKLTKPNKYQFIQDGSSIKCNMTLKANDEQIYLYTIELIS